MRQGMRDRGVAAMVVTPGADLRFLADYDAKALERLTALVIPVTGNSVLIAPQLEDGEARESGFGRAGGRVVTWTETEDPFSIVATIVAAGLAFGLGRWTSGPEHDPTSSAPIEAPADTSWT